MEERFSDRLGITKPPALQLESMTNELQTSLWNLLDALFQRHRDSGEGWKAAARVLASGFFKERVDLVPQANWWNARDWVASRFFELEWWNVYNLLEFVRDSIRSTGSTATLADFELGVNRILEREAAGYRFIADKLAPITSSAELAAIQETLDAAKRLGLQGVHAHIDKAVSCLSQKPQPDYHNAAKEAISSVEAAAKLISGELAARGLDIPLTELKKRGVAIHGALEKAVLSLYGYSSDEDGIRHPILDDPSAVGFDEAKFLIVSCSAFVNFLISKANTAGLLKPRQ